MRCHVDGGWLSPDRARTPGDGYCVPGKRADAVSLRFTARRESPKTMRAISEGLSILVPTEPRTAAHEDLSI